MNAETTEHPSCERLAAYAAGRTGAAESAEIEKHLAYCEPCCAEAEALPGDPLDVILRKSGAALAGPVPGGEKSEQPAPEAVRKKGAPVRVSAGVPPALAKHSRYRLLKLLGSGGMGVVYQAEHRLMERAVALKVIHRRWIADPGAVARFRREVRAAARLSHPNIVIAYDAEQAGDTHFLVMEFVAGTNLAMLVAEQGPLPVAEACDYVRQAALGLQHAFERGMVHRDIKPQNLMRTPEGLVKILDFGLASFVTESVPAGWLTELDSVMGTPDYLAPEQARNAHAADIRADLYSLGCTLYHLLGGEVPFPGRASMQKVVAHLEQTAQPLEELRPDVPPELGRIVSRLMAKDPAQRLATPADLAQALVPFAGGMPAGAGLAGGRRRKTHILSTQAGGPDRVVGTLVLDFAADCPRDAVVLLDGTEVPCQDAAAVEMTLRAGEHILTVTRGGVEIRADTFTLTPASRHIISITGAPAHTPVTGTRDKVRSRTLEGHTGRVLGVVFSPDNLLLASASHDQTVKLWDVARGKECLTLQGHTGPVRAVAFSPNGQLLASGSDDQAVKLWEADTGRERSTWQKHTGPVRGVAFSPDGRLLASISYDQGIRLWDVDAGEERCTLHGHTDRVLCLAFSAAGLFLVSGSHDRTVKLWDVASGAVQRTVAIPGEAVFALALSPETGMLAAAGDRIQVYSVETAATQRTLAGHRGAIYCLAFSPDGRLLASGGADRSVRLWAPASGEVRRTLAGHKGAVTGLAFSSQGLLASASMDQTVKLWDLGFEGPSREDEEQPI